MSPPHPPVHSSISLYWNTSHHTLDTTVHRKVKGFVSYNLARATRSALQVLAAWTEAFSNPATTVRDQNSRILQVTRVALSDSLLATMTNTDMQRRLGIQVTPSLSLLQCHILWNQAFRETSYKQAFWAENYAAAQVIALSQLAELLAWLVWLHAGELFAIAWFKVQAVPLRHGGTYAFPTSVGCLIFHLLDQKKYSQDTTADVVIAWSTPAGLQPDR